MRKAFQTVRAQAVVEMLFEFGPDFGTHGDMHTPTALDGSSALKRIPAGFADNRFPQIRIEESCQGFEFHRISETPAYQLKTQNSKTE